MMPSTSEIQELEGIEEEMNNLQLQRQQLTDRQAAVTVLEELEKQSHHEQESEITRTSMEKIKKELEILFAKKEVLQERRDQILHPKSQSGSAPENAVDKHVIASPPSMKAPKVFLDVTELPTTPSRTQCPVCHAFITTETVSRVGSTAWLVCFMSILLGCVAGCCLLPFCMSQFKDVEHRCPNCQSQIHTNRKL